MGFFGKSRRASSPPPEAAIYSYNLAPLGSTFRGRVMNFPPNVLTRIFSYICPHTHDETFTTCDESLGEGCMICQTYDLSQCALVCRKWRKVAIPMLVRLDAVHFCGWEDMNDLRPTRKKKSKGDRKRKDAGTAEGRLQLFAQTVRENRRLANLVCVLKIAYMTRESCKADLARTVAVMPNLRYVDVPDGVFSDESSCMALKHELENRCMDLRKTKFLRGSERAFTAMAERRLWRNLEALEVEGVDVEADALLYTLASFATLREVKLANMLVLNDELLTPNPSFSLFPAVERLVLEKAPGVTATGLCSLLSRPTLKQNLMSLTLKDTGVLPQELHPVLGAATHLVELSMTATVERPFPLAPIPPLASNTLETLFFGILPEHINNNSPVSESYYTYVASSLLANGLPALSALFAYSSLLPDSLSAALLPTAEGLASEHHKAGATGETVDDYFLRPPAARGMRNITARLSTYSISSYYQSGSPNESRPTTSSGPPTLNLDLYTKPPSQPEVEWSLTQLRSTAPPSPGPTPQSAPPTVPSYTPSHFSTPNVKPQPQHGTSNSLASIGPGSSRPSVDAPRIGAAVPPAPTMKEIEEHAQSGNAIGNGLVPPRNFGGSNTSLPLPSHVISSTRPLSTIFAERQKQRQQQQQQQQHTPQKQQRQQQQQSPKRQPQQQQIQQKQQQQQPPPPPQNAENFTYRPARTSSIQPHPSFSMPNVRSASLPSSQPPPGSQRPPGHHPPLGSQPPPSSNPPPGAHLPAGIYPQPGMQPPPGAYPPPGMQPAFHRSREALQPIDAYAIGRIGSGRVQSGRVASGIIASGYGGFPAVPREWLDSESGRNSGLYGDEKGHDDGMGSAASWRTKRKGGVIGDWMG